jgi:hypothetical protein
MLMQLLLKKISTILLIVLVMATSLNNASGVMACEHGVSSEIHQSNHHVDEHKDHLPKGDRVLHAQHLTRHGDTCRDYIIQLDNDFLKKRINVVPPPNVSIYLFSNTLPNPKISFLPTNSVYPITSQILSQTLLSHRTVVLLN